jgi:hypothetical protein
LGILGVYRELESIAKGFSDAVVDTRIIKLPSGEPLKLRVYIVDGCFLDVWISISGKYSYYWERRHVDGRINANPAKKHQDLLNVFGIFVAICFPILLRSISFFKRFLLYIKYNILPFFSISFF